MSRNATHVFVIRFVVAELKKTTKKRPENGLSKRTKKVNCCQNARCSVGCSYCALRALLSFFLLFLLHLASLGPFTFCGPFLSSVKSKKESKSIDSTANHTRRVRYIAACNNVLQ